MEEKQARCFRESIGHSDLGLLEFRHAYLFEPIPRFKLKLIVRKSYGPGSHLIEKKVWVDLLLLVITNQIECTI
jgi:hypothetical protein